MPLYFPPTNMRISGNTAGTTALISSGTLTLAGGNNITLSQNGNAITISGGVGGGGGAAVGISTIGNTAGTSGTFSSGTVVFAGGDNVTLSQSTGTDGATITISAANAVVLGGGPAVGVGGGNTVGDVGQFSTGTVMFAGGNNITLSQATDASGATITISGGAGGGFAAGVSTGGNTTGSTGLVSSQLVLVGGTNITLLQSTGTNNDATISIIGQPIVSFYEPYPFHNTGTGAISLQTNSSGAMSLFRIAINVPVAAEMVGMVFSASFATTTVTQSFSQSGTIQWGIYSNPVGASSSRMLLLGSNSFNYFVSHSSGSYTFNHPTTTNAGGVYSTGNTNSAGANITSGYTGLKLMFLGLGSTIPPGDYWIGIHHRNSSVGANAGIRFSLYGNTASITGLAPLGSFSSAYSTGTNVPSVLGGNWMNANGSYTLAGLTGLTSDITMSQITQNVGLQPYQKYITRV